MTKPYVFVWCLHHVGEAVGLYTFIHQLQLTAWGTRSWSVSMLHLVVKFAMVFVWVRIDVRGSKPQWESAKTDAWTQVLTIASPVFYYICTWPFPIHAYIRDQFKHVPLIGFVCPLTNNAANVIWRTPYGCALSRNRIQFSIFHFFL